MAGGWNGDLTQQNREKAVFSKDDPVEWLEAGTETLHPAE
jgi:hypothetical protein